MSNEDFRTILAMKKYGGSFIRQLAELAVLADPENLRKLRICWPNYWQQYKELGNGKEFDNPIHV